MGELSKSLRNLTTDGDATAISSQERLVIAIDFGTTYSGVAYCFADQKDPKIFAVVHWPGELFMAQHILDIAGCAKLLSRW
jgi:hypothetical protein